MIYVSIRTFLRLFRDNYSWFDWLHIAPQHLVNHYLVLCKGVGLILQTKPHIPCRKLMLKRLFSVTE